MSKLIATCKIRPLKDNECYYCHNGCGECETVVVNDNNLIINGEILEYTEVDVSSCCHSKVGIWDDLHDWEATDSEYIYKEIDSE